MKVSGFSFIRNGEQLGYPFKLSIESVLPICDEFVIAVGRSCDHTLDIIKSIGSDKIRIVETDWCDGMRTKGFVYAEQKMIAQYLCTGDWVFYLEGDELIHENDYGAIVAAMKNNIDNPKAEVLIFDYLHFVGNINTYVWSPAWYRKAPRILKRSLRAYAPDGLYWLLLDKNNRRARYPRGVEVGVPIYHYGWVRTQAQCKSKIEQISGYWGGDGDTEDFSHANEVDPACLHLFDGQHPRGVTAVFPHEEGLYSEKRTKPLTRRERKHRLSVKVEKWLGIDLSRKHYRLVK